MLRTLIEQAQRLPGEVETLIHQAAETKQGLHDLLQDRAKLEAQVAGEVANESNGDGKKKYPNEEARKAEIARRLQANEIYQANEEAIRKAREAVVDLEARLDRNRYEHRTATALLNLLAAAIQAGRQDVEGAILKDSQEVQRAEAKKKFTQALKEITEEKPASGNITNGNGLKEAKVTVLEAKPGKNQGTIRAYCQTEGGEKVAVYAKNGTGKKLAAAVGEKVAVKFKEIDHGWFAVAVN
jgi:DNA repair exonuclease SbcCD ATPase subunit